MEQFLDADNKWHITLTVDIPRVIVKNKLNFRLHSIVMKDGSIVRDPSLVSSNYIFKISASFLGKKAFFFSFFDASQIEDISEFKFGLCDEGVRWYGNTIFSVKNEYIKNEIILKPEIQELDVTNDTDSANEELSEINTDISSYIDPKDIVKLTSRVESLVEEPLLVSRLENPKKITSKKFKKKKD